MDRFKKKLTSNKSELTTNNDLYSKINLNSNEKMLPTGDINKIINISERFNLERNNSNIYRIITTVKPLMSNVLFNTSGENSLSIFSSDDFRDGSSPKNGISVLDEEDLTYKEAINNNLVEKEGWFGYIENNIGGELCKFIDLEPSRDKFNLLSTGETKNWDTFITYPYKSISEPGDITFDGLLIVDKQTVNVGGRLMISFGVPIKHGLLVGDKIKLKNVSNDVNGVYVITRLGLDDGELIDNYFCVDISPSLITVLQSNVRFSRLVGNNESNYYFRKFKKVNTVRNEIMNKFDSESYRLGFSQTIFKDATYQITFSEDISIENLLDNLGRPVSEIFLTFIKNNEYENNSFFSSIKSGIKMNFINGINDNINIPDINRIHNGGNNPFPSHSFIEENIDSELNEFYGDIVEYNHFELKEKVLGKINHRFNTINRETESTILVDNENINLGVRQEGYVYSPFHQIKIKEFSNYIEQGDLNTEGIPDYAIDLNDGRFLWRDILDLSINNDVNHPFLNNAHYIYKNVDLILNRQDPFGTYNLLHTTFPRDIIGDKLNNIFEVKNNNDEC